MEGSLAYGFIGEGDWFNARRVLKDWKLSELATGECQRAMQQLEQILSCPPPGGNRRQLWATYKAMAVREIVARISNYLVFSQPSEIQGEWQLVEKYFYRGEYSSAGVYLSNIYNQGRGVECNVALGVLFLKLCSENSSITVTERCGILIGKLTETAKGLEITSISTGTAADTAGQLSSAGLMPGDTITVIDSQSVAGISTEQVNALLSGSKESPPTAQLNVRGADGKLRAVTVEREPWLDVKSNAPKFQVSHPLEPWKG